VYAFTTFDPTASTARFTVWNDTHQRDETLAKLIDLLEAHPGDFHVWNGDIFDFINSEDVLVKQVLHPAGRVYAAERPLVFVRGNHDARGSYARELARVIETPNGRSYYSFRQGPLACLVLDTGEDKDDAHPEYGGLNDFADYRREERRWLEQAIAQPEFQSAPFRVVFQHIPLRANGTDRYNDSRTQWEPLLARARIDFMFSGHVHTFAFREATTEQPFPLLIGGGPKPDQATFIHAQATEQLLDVQALALDGRELGHWIVPRRAP
jgi:acid phosphatase type 7